jgi:hypothetical protein
MECEDGGNHTVTILARESEIERKAKRAVVELLKEHIDDVYRHRSWSWKDVLATTVGGTIQATITF